MKTIFFAPLFFIFAMAHSQTATTLKEELIVDKYLKNGAWRFGLFSKEWQEKIDEGLKEDSTIAYLWQQKAMPLFKQQKYQLGMTYLDRAVKLKPEKWMDYRGFIKCIFAKDYRGAIEDFEFCIKDYGNRFVMDHSYAFYQAICFLQLNQFEKTEKILVRETEKVRSEKGESWVHPLELFYLGIAKMEQRKNQEALLDFERAILIYPQFSDAKYYKAFLLGRFGKNEEGHKLLNEAHEDFEKGFTITEDNVIYEKYPYQVNWKLVKIN